MKDEEVDAEMAANGINAPRVTAEQINGMIAKDQYYVFPGTTLTVCCLTLINGFAVTGESACASPENFDPYLGRHLAYEKAREKIWALEGYRLRHSLWKKDL